MFKNEQKNYYRFRTLLYRPRIMTTRRIQNM